MAPIDIYVKLTGGKTCELRLDSARNVEEIYSSVADMEKVARNRVLIKYAGKVLKPSLTIEYTGIRTETILKAEIIDVRVWSIAAKLPSGEECSISVQNVDTIDDVRREIVSKVKLSGTQRLKYSGRTLDDAKLKLTEAGLTDGSVVEVITESETPEEEREQQQLEDKDAILRSFNAAGRPVEVVFSFDTTGSMSSCLQKVREDLEDTVRSLLERVPLIRIGIIAHGDYCDDSSSTGYSIRIQDLTADVETLVRFVNQVPSTSGGDSPECYEWVLHKAQQLDWSENSAKALVVIGDCEPHPPSYTDQNINWHDELDVLKGMGVKAYGIRALNSIHSKPFYEDLAEQTHGAYVEFKNFDIIKEMFLAVCYREASEGEYKAFCDEVLTKDCDDDSKKEDIKDMFKQLNQQETTACQNVVKSNRYVSAAWWDPSLDSARPSYRYIAKTDKWEPITSQVREHSLPLAGFAPGNDDKRRSVSIRKNCFSWRKGKRSSIGEGRHSKSSGRCSVM